MLVGDSVNRNQFESILCLFREGLQNKSRMYEVHGHKITKGRGYYVFKFEVSKIFPSSLSPFLFNGMFTKFLIKCNRNYICDNDSHHVYQNMKIREFCGAHIILKEENGIASFSTSRDYP